MLPYVQRLSGEYIDKQSFQMNCEEEFYPQPGNITDVTRGGNRLAYPHRAGFGQSVSSQCHRVMSHVGFAESVSTCRMEMDVAMSGAQCGPFGRTVSFRMLSLVEFLTAV